MIALDVALHLKQARSVPVLISRRTDYTLLTILLIVFMFDASTMSYWGPTSQDALLYEQKQFGTEMRLVVYSFQIIYIGLNITYFLRALLSNRMLAVVMAIIFASILWSSEPMRSFGTALRLVLLVVSLALARERHGAEKVALLLYPVFASILLLQLLGLFDPALTFMTGDHAGEYRGFFKHKNTLGSFCSIGSAVMMAGMLNRDFSAPYRAFMLATFVITAVLVVLSHSATSLAIVACMVAMAPLVLIYNWFESRRLTIVTIVAVIAVAIVVLEFDLLDVVLGLLGRDSTFTDRSVIWKFCLRYISLRPVLGWGYNALDLARLLNADQRGGHVFVVGSAHNSYLEIALGLGYTGLAVYFAFVVSMVARATAMRHMSLPFTFVAVAYLFAGMTESLSGLAIDVSFCTFLLSCPPPAPRPHANRSIPGFTSRLHGRIRSA